MSLQAILDAIHASGETQVREIEAQAQTTADEILAEARVNARHLRQDARDRVVVQSAKESAFILQQARLEALQIVGSVRETLVDVALGATRERLADLRSDPTYPDVLRRLTEEALCELGSSLRESERPQLAADPRDRKLLEGILREMRRELPVKYVLNCQGGVIASSEDERVVVINTLEARFERAALYLRRSFSALFEEAAPVTERM